MRLRNTTLVVIKGDGLSLRHLGTLGQIEQKMPQIKCQSKPADCTSRLPRIMSKQTSYDGDTWPNPRHKLARQASRWPALRAVGEVPRSNRIRSKDQNKASAFWRIGLTEQSSVGHFRQGSEALQRGCRGVGRQSAYRPDSLVAPCKFMPRCRPGKGFVSNDPFFGPHKGTYGAAWLKQLPSRGINLCPAAVLV